MRFSGHETFPIREGWLHKGLKLLNDDPERFLDEEVADYLGVGRNMAKSIKHWLQVTGLAESSSDGTRGKSSLLHLTNFGEIVWQNDPYLLEEGTWWLLHANLVNNPTSASTWAWFFNNFSHDRFDRAVCLESLRRYIESAQKRVPSTATLARDLGCMLLSYARTVPAAGDDPEDGADCPFRELGLLSYYKTSGYYQIHQGPKNIPPSVFGYVMALAFADPSRSTKRVDIKLMDAARSTGGPGRVFCLSGETLFETVSQIEASDTDILEIAGMAGDRTIRILCMEPLEWAELFFENIEEEAYA